MCENSENDGDKYKKVYIAFQIHTWAWKIALLSTVNKLHASRSYHIKWLVGPSWNTYEGPFPRSYLTLCPPAKHTQSRILISLKEWNQNTICESYDSTPHNPTLVLNVPSCS